MDTCAFNNECTKVENQFILRDILDAKYFQRNISEVEIWTVEDNTICLRGKPASPNDTDVTVFPRTVLASERSPGVHRTDTASVEEDFTVDALTQTIDKFSTSSPKYDLPGTTDAPVFTH